MSVDWTPENYEYSYENYNQEENSSAPVHHENPDWYYTEDGRYQSCLGALLGGMGLLLLSSLTNIIK